MNFIFACVLFLINGLLGRMQYLYRNIFEYEIFSFEDSDHGNYSGNFFQMIINPVVFVTIICSFLQSKGNTDMCFHLWQVILFFWLLRFFRFLIKGRISFVNWRYEFISFFISNVLGIFVLFNCLLPLIEANKNIFISLENLRDAIWVAIIFYIFKVIWDICKCALESEYVFSEKRKEKVVNIRYKKFYKKYNSHIVGILEKMSKDALIMRDFKNLIYSVMIYEDYNRPFIYRKIEGILKRILPNKQMTLGIMQFKTYRYITDLESIEMACKKLYNDYLNNLDDAPIEKAIYNYNISYSYQSEVMAIFNIINN